MRAPYPTRDLEPKTLKHPAALEGALNELPALLDLSGLPVSIDMTYMRPVTGYTLEAQLRQALGLPPILYPVPELESAASGGGDGLSGGAIAGLVIGVLAAAAAVAVLAGERAAPHGAYLRCLTSAGPWERAHDAGPQYASTPRCCATGSGISASGLQPQLIIYGVDMLFYTAAQRTWCCGGSGGRGTRKRRRRRCWRAHPAQPAWAASAAAGAAPTTPQSRSGTVSNAKRSAIRPPRWCWPALKLAYGAQYCLLEQSWRIDQAFCGFIPSCNYRRTNHIVLR